MFAALFIAAATISWHVDASAAPGGDGMSWPTAFRTIDEALSVAQPWDELWVAAGIYKPRRRTDLADPRSATYSLERIALYGGFAGNETTLAQRAGLFGQTILDGDIGAPGARDDNAYHVITARRTVVLDGFVVQNGHARGAIEGRGAGLLGMITPGQFPQPSVGPRVYMANCTFRENRSPVTAGAIYLQLFRFEAYDCTFESNRSNNGGAMVLQVGDAWIYNCRFLGNEAVNRGGAVHLPSNQGNPPSVLFVNCVFAGNRAAEGGAAYLVGAQFTSGNAIWSSCTITQNAATQIGGAMVAHDYPSGTLTDPVNLLGNCIVWGNQAPVDPNLSGLAQPSFCLIEGWVGGPASVFDADPLFVGAAIGDFHLQAGSPAIDHGHALAMLPDQLDIDGDLDTTELMPIDLDHNPRGVDDPSVLWGVPPYYDLGAYER